MSGMGMSIAQVRSKCITAHADLNIVKADMELTHEVMPKLTQVLKTLVRKYSPIHSMVSSPSLIMLILISFS